MNQTARRGSILKVFLGVLALAFVAAVLWPLQAGGGPSPITYCLSNIKQCNIGFLMYASDDNDILPRADRWMDLEQPYIKNEHVYHEPTLANKADYGYAFRDRASSLKMAKIAKPAEFIVLFDSTLLGRNAHGESWAMPRPGRHGGENNVGFLDGHAKRLIAP